METATENLNGYLEDNDFEKWEDRLVSILLVNQIQHYSNEQESKSQRIADSRICGSLCTSENNLPGEVWKPYPEKNVYSISNYERVGYKKQLVP